MIERTALAQNCPLNVRYQLSSADLLRSLVKAGLGFSIMPRNAFPDDEARGIVVREIVDPDMARTQSIVWMADHALTPAGEAVRNTLLELIVELIDNGTLRPVCSPKLLEIRSCFPIHPRRVPASCCPMGESMRLCRAGECAGPGAGRA